MLFNSVEFLFFLPIVFFLYWFLFKNKLNLQNLFIVVASYLFYGWWDWRFLLLIVFSTLLDYVIGLKMITSKTEKSRKLLLTISLITNLGLLFVFKYYHFFIDSFAIAFPYLTSSNSIFNLTIILPVGISFYTFQTLSYNIDIYKHKLKPTSNFIAFAAFVSFFPQLVAGPIERATHLLPQFLKNRKFNYPQAVTGIQLIAWGFFKKLVIADNAAIIVNGIFNNYQTQTSTSLILGAILFAFQIYGDFSGYSDIAIGLSRLFGFDLMTNFKFPYLSKNISEFWKRWHISLSTWFRDYVYIPLGGSKTTKQKAIRNILIVFIVSGFWHGANWTFIFWGMIHALLYIPLFLGSTLKLPKVIKITWTFLLVTLAWIFFRAKNIKEAFEYIYLIVNNNNTHNFYLSTRKYLLITCICLSAIVYLLSTEYYFNKRNKYEILLNKYWLILMITITVFLGAFKNHASFIYFQF